jgi:hypothetical protein
LSDSTITSGATFSSACTRQGQQAHGDVAHGINLAHVDHQVGLRLRAAEQRHPLRNFSRAQCLRLVIPLVNFTRQHLALAGSTGAIATTIRQSDAGGIGGIEDGLVMLGFEAVPGGIDGDLEGHEIISR